MTLGASLYPAAAQFLSYATRVNYDGQHMFVFQTTAFVALLGLISLLSCAGAGSVGNCAFLRTAVASLLICTAQIAIWAILHMVGALQWPINTLSYIAALLFPLALVFRVVRGQREKGSIQDHEFGRSRDRRTSVASRIILVVVVLVFCGLFVALFYRRFFGSWLPAAIRLLFPGALWDPVR
jgi:hypothetical protein